MKREFFISVTLALFFILSGYESNACTGGANDQGSLTATAGYQTILVHNGYYYSMNVICGNTYNFDFCGNGGNTDGSLWPEISILDVTGNTQYGFSPYSGGCSTLSWLASFSGTIRILITDSGCNMSLSYYGTMAYNYSTAGVIDPSFTLTESCGGGIATVTGTPGGVFTFNPLPGDGSQINSSTGIVSNGTVGTTYFVEYTLCGSSSIETVTVLTDDCYSLNGSAQYISVSGEDCIQLTSETNNQTGCAWNGSQVDFNTNFSLSLDYYFGNNINGADGNTFTFQPSSSSACGQDGGQLGAGGLTNALSVEFDTYDNDDPTHLYDMACDHIAVEIDGNMLGPGAPYSGPFCAKSLGGNIDDGGTYEVEIVWDAATHQLDVFFDGDLRLSCTGDFVNTVFGGQSLVYWGATSATGGFNNQQYFCPSTVSVLPAEMISFGSSCEPGVEIFTWQTATENNVDYFEVEFTLDGMIFYPIGLVQAVGNSTEMNSYSLRYSNQDRTQKYFRVKTFDKDGSFKASDLISGKNCALPELLEAYSFHDDHLQIHSLAVPMELSLLNTAGQELRSIVVEDASNVIMDDLILSQGIYLLKMKEIKTEQINVYRIYR